MYISMEKAHGICLEDAMLRERAIAYAARWFHSVPN